MLSKVCIGCYFLSKKYEGNIKYTLIYTTYYINNKPLEGGTIKLTKIFLDNKVDFFFTSFVDLILKSCKYFIKILLIWINNPWKWNKLNCRYNLRKRNCDWQNNGTPPQSLWICSLTWQKDFAHVSLGWHTLGRGSYPGLS